MQSLEPAYSALVIGASGEIGRALCEEIANDPRCGSLLRLSRSTSPDFDLRKPEAFVDAIRAISGAEPFSLVIDATGVLSTTGAGPEKSLAAIHPAALHDLMQVNAFGPILLLRELLPLLSRGRCLYGKLSARVGSITDNRLGGWYGYRTSKASLNMLLQTSAIELHRRLPGLVIAAMQPGTVVSPLSRRFISASTPVLSARQAASGLLCALDLLPAQSGAHFIDHAGKVIPW
jgi:NAD(P)-dependent dehydrogenase (short-subunit alcohol dehydrogenase family)